LPYGLYVLGSRAGERRNGMTLNWATQVSFEPKLVAVSVERESFTHQLVEEGGVFCLNVIDREDRAIVRKFTKPVELDLAASTLNGFAFHDGLSGAPVLDQAVAYLDCRVHQRVELAGLRAVQEIDRNQSRSGGFDQTAEVARAVGAAAWRFEPAIVGEPGGVWRAAADGDVLRDDEPAYGVALVSRLPVQEWRVVRLA